MPFLALPWGGIKDRQDRHKKSMVAAAESAIDGMAAHVTSLGTAALAVIALIAVFVLAKGFLARSSR